MVIGAYNDKVPSSGAHERSLHATLDIVLALPHHPPLLSGSSASEWCAVSEQFWLICCYEGLLATASLERCVMPATALRPGSHSCGQPGTCHARCCGNMHPQTFRRCCGRVPVQT